MRLILREVVYGDHAEPRDPTKFSSSVLHPWAASNLNHLRAAHCSNRRTFPEPISMFLNSVAFGIISENRVAIRAGIDDTPERTVA